MTLDPRLRVLLPIARALDSQEGKTVVDARAGSAALSDRFRFLAMPSGPKMAEEVDRLIPVDGGQIRIRIYRPRRTSSPLPLHVFLHGGGWVLGTLYERDPRCREIAARADCIVISVDYRLAPENAFPTPVEDCYAALVWAHDHADEIGVDPTRIAVGGESAGANLAAVLCLVSRDRGGPALCHQWLDIPATDLTMTQPSFTEVPDGYLLDGAAMREFRRYYIGDRPLERDPYVSPLFAPGHSGLPPAWILSAEYDKLRDDGKAYAAALEAAGVPVRYQVLPGHVHSSVVMTRLFPSAKAYETEAIAALAKAFANA